MGNIRFLIGSLFLFFFLQGCGIQELAQQTRDEVQKGNTLQQGLLDATRAVLDGVTRTANDTHALKHGQTLAASLSGMFTPENTQQSSTSSAPLAMVPFAKGFAEEASADEVVLICDLLRREALDTGGGLIPRTQAVVALFGLGFIAGQIPLDVYKAALVTHVDQAGPYEETLYFASMARYVFIRDGFFTPITQQAKILNIGTLRLAVSYYLLMKQMAKLTYVAKFGINIPAMRINYTLNPQEVIDLGKQAQAQFKTMLDPAVYQSAEAQNLLKSFNF